MSAMLHLAVTASLLLAASAGTGASNTEGQSGRTLKEAGSWSSPYSSGTWNSDGSGSWNSPGSSGTYGGGNNGNNNNNNNNNNKQAPSPSPSNDTGSRSDDQHNAQNAVNTANSVVSNLNLGAIGRKLKAGSYSSPYASGTYDNNGGTWNSPYSSGSWGNGGTNNNNNNNNNNTQNTQNTQNTPSKNSTSDSPAPAPQPSPDTPVTAAG